MSTPLVTAADLPPARAVERARPRIWLRAVSFTALALYGVQRWSRLLVHPPGWRLVGLVALAVALAVIVPLVRHLLTDAPRPVARAGVGVLTAVIVLAALPLAGLRWEWVTHLRIAVSARAIGDGLGSLGGVLVPYLGHGYSIRLVMTLGAAVLLLDGAAALAFATRSSGELGDGRRAAAALPLIALAIVPATLVRPTQPALQGLLLFGLLALFMWGERIARDGVAVAVGVAVAAGVAGAIGGPLIEGSRPWVDYQAWAGSAPGSGLESFDWNQSYGTLTWPQTDRIVLMVHARRGDYWKATDLTEFDGGAWVTGAPQGATESALPAPPPAVVHRYTEPVTVTIDQMQTSDVIGGSGVTGEPELAGGVRAGAVPGTWVADHALQQGDVYTVRTYSPTPTPAMLRQVDRPADYPSAAALAPSLRLTLPTGGSNVALDFPGFHTAPSAALTHALAGSPYERAFALAQRLAGESASPYDFVERVRGLLDGGDYVYEPRASASGDPLLSFLFHSHVGYCQQFSGSMALLLRMGGVPARVAAGFSQGTFDATAHTWTITDVDAHAWVEVWFPRYGWVRFDPTPSSASGVGRTGIEPGLGRGSASPAPLRATHLAPGTPIVRHATPVARAAGSGGGARPEGGAPSWPWWVAGGLALALAAGLALRGMLSAPDPLVELERALARTGRPLRDGTTLVTLERRFRDSPPAAAYVRALRLERYGHPTEPPSRAGRRAVRAELRSGLGLAGRLRVLWALPPRR